MAEKIDQMQIADEKTVRQWYRLIEDGVPQDKAWDRLRSEATVSTAPAEYRDSWKTHSVARDVLSINDLTRAEYLVLRMYTADSYLFYKRFNEDCRNSKWTFYTVFTSLLQTALCKRRRKHAETYVTLYRGMNCKAYVDARDDLYSPNFMSASMSKAIAKKFGKEQIVIATSTIGCIAENSVYPEEVETLIPPFQCFTRKENASQYIFMSDIDKTSPFLATPLIKGSLLGAVVGNCLAEPYEFKPPKTVEMVLQDLQKMENTEINRGKSRYTCDTCMTLALAESLTRVQNLDIGDLKNCFAMAYVNDPNRNYGSNTAEVLKELHKQTKEDDHFAPAKALFNGNGSFGNGGAMRIAPLALYYFYEREKEFDKLVESATALTHSNQISVNGAILQATAVQLAAVSSVEGDHSDDFREIFVNKLMRRMQTVETGTGPYGKKLEKIKNYLTKSPSTEVVRKKLGNGISAELSVPTAIYCFLRGMKPIAGMPSDRTEFERIVIYAISLGGDTDTIASMAGAIAGAYYGQDSVTQRWRDLCEAQAVEDAKAYANKMISQLFWDGT